MTPETVYLDPELYGRCKSERCPCLRLDDWPGSVCPDWEPMPGKMTIVDFRNWVLKRNCADE
jgi:hypothetical protein